MKFCQIRKIARPQRDFRPAHRGETIRGYQHREAEDIEAYRDYRARFSGMNEARDTQYEHNR